MNSAFSFQRYLNPQRKAGQMVDCAMIFDIKFFANENHDSAFVVAIRLQLLHYYSNFSDCIAQTCQDISSITVIYCG